MNLLRIYIIKYNKLGLKKNVERSEITEETEWMKLQQFRYKKDSASIMWVRDDYETLFLHLHVLTKEQRDNIEIQMYDLLEFIKGEVKDALVAKKKV